MNHLYFGDCLDVLKQLKEENPEPFIDLIYIDPPFNSKRNYNVLFESIDIKDANSQKQAFADIWSNYEYVDTRRRWSCLHRDFRPTKDLASALKPTAIARVGRVIQTERVRVEEAHPPPNPIDGPGRV